MPLYRADVTRVTSDGVFVKVPELAIGYEFGPMPMPAAGTLSVGDDVVVGSVSAAREDLVILSGQGAGVASSGIWHFETLAARDAVLPEPQPSPTFAWVDDDLTLYAYSDEAVAGWYAIAGAPTPLYLNDLTDVVLTSPAVGNLLRFDGSNWVNVSTVDLIGSATTTDSLTFKVSSDTQTRLIINANGRMEWGNGSLTQDTVLYRSAANVLGTDGLFRITGGSTGTELLALWVSGDANYRFHIFANGVMRWGGGVTAQDVILFRAGPDLLQLQDQFQVQRSNATDRAFSSLVLGDIKNRFQHDTAGKMEWGPGGSSVDPDTNLFRSTTNTLKTDSFFVADGGLSVKTIEIDTSGAATGHLLRHNGTKFVSVAEDTNPQYPNSKGIAFAPNTSTTSTTLADIASASFSFTKVKGSATNLRIQLDTSWFTNNSGSNVTFAVRVNGVDYTIAKSFSVNATTRLSAGGVIYVTGLAAGTYTIQGRWSTSTGTLSSNNDDWYTLDCMEVKA